MLIPRSVIHRIARPISTAFGIHLNTSVNRAPTPCSPAVMRMNLRPQSLAINVRAMSTAINVSESELEAHLEGNKETLDNALKALRAKQTDQQSLTLADFEPCFKELEYIRDFPLAYALLGELKAAGLTPTPEIVALVVGAGRRSLRSHEMKEIFGDATFRSPGRTEEATETTHAPSTPFYEQIKGLVSELHASGQELPVTFYDEMAAHLLSQNQCGVLINIAIALEGKGVQLPTRFYNRMIHALPRHGYTDRADVLFARMLQNGMADAQTYVNRMGSLVYCNRMDAAAQVFADLRATFGTPNEVAYNIMIKSCLEGKQPKKALELFEQMKQESTPNNITFNTFLTYGYEGQDLETVNAVVPYFFERGFPSAASEYSCLFKFYSRHDPVQCVELYRTMVQKNVTMTAELYNAFLHALLDRQVPPEWKRNLGNLLTDRVYPQGDSPLSSICLSLPYHTRHILARMEACKVEPTSVTFELLMRCFMTRKDWMGAKSLFNHMLANHINLIHPIHRNIHLSALLHSDAPESEIQTALSAMRARRCPVNSLNAQRLSERRIRLPIGLYSLPHANRFAGEQGKNPRVASFKDYQQ